MGAADDDVYFFVHVLKTGGTRPELIRKRILLAEPCALATKTMTILREPVARTISMASIDVVGVRERCDRFLMVHDELGWPPPSRPWTVALEHAP